MAKKLPPLPRITFTIPRDIMKEILRLKRVNKRRSLQQAWEDLGRLTLIK
jgi:hypothetical protein